MHQRLLQQRPLIELTRVRLAVGHARDNTHEELRDRALLDGTHAQQCSRL
jgi:hypothetical protein